MPSAFQRQAYDNRVEVGRMADLMRDSGQIRASATAANGQGWANQIGRMGDLVAGAIRDYPRLKDEEARRQREAEVNQRRDDEQKDAERIQTAIRESIDPATGRMDFGKAATLIGQIDPLKAEAFWKEADAVKAREAEKEREKATELAKGFASVLAIGGRDAEAGPGALQEAPRAYAAFRENAIKRGLAAPEDLPEQYDEAQVQIRALETMSTAQVFDTLFRAPNAPKTSVLAPGAKLVDDRGREIASNPRPDTPTKVGTHVVDGRLVDDSGRVLYTSPDAGRTGGRGSGSGTSNTNALRDDIRMAEQWKQKALSEAEKAFRESYDPNLPANDPTNAQLIRTHEDEKRRIQESYLVQIGAPPQAQPIGTHQRNAGTMRELLTSPPSARPSPPFGAGTANAAPSAPSAAPRPAPENAPYRLNFHGKILTFKTRADAAAWAKRLGLELDEK